MTPTVVLLSFLGGLAPALVWLFFWLLEDRCEPEPRIILFGTFLAGGIAAGLAYPLEIWLAGYASGHLLVAYWAIVEEVLKFAAAYFVAFRSRAFDEPLDAVVYLVTAAIGFAAVENMLYLIEPISSGNVISTLALGEMRFMGTSLLHILGSATTGIAIALAFFRPARERVYAAIGGVILAVMLHTGFNLSILVGGTRMTFLSFLFIWTGVVTILLFTERVKIPARDYC